MNAEINPVQNAEITRLRLALEAFREWHAERFGDFDSETNAQLLCLDNEAAYALDGQSSS